MPRLFTRLVPTPAIGGFSPVFSGYPLMRDLPDLCKRDSHHALQYSFWSIKIPGASAPLQPRDQEGTVTTQEASQLKRCSVHFICRSCTHNLPPNHTTAPAAASHKRALDRRKRVLWWECSGRSSCYRSVYLFSCHPTTLPRLFARADLRPSIVCSGGRLEAICFFSNDFLALLPPDHTTSSAYEPG